MKAKLSIKSSGERAAEFDLSIFGFLPSAFCFTSPRGKVSQERVGKLSNTVSIQLLATSPLFSNPKSDKGELFMKML